MFIIDGRNFFNHTTKIDLKIYNIRKTVTGQGDDYITGCIPDYRYFKEHFKLIAVYLSKQQKLDADPKAIQQISFTENPETKCNNIFHYWNERNSFKFFKRNN